MDLDDDRIWDPSRAVAAADIALLDRIVDGRWGGPLIVSMPRTGSTLLGTLFLLASDPPGSGRHVFDRYVHEPAAPVFWEGRDLGHVGEVVEGRLGERDVVQESAYQFADPRIARWFLHQARQPVAFTVRHPRIAWPSRWRIMLRMRLAAGVDGNDEARIRKALGDQDYSHLGDVLTEAVTSPDNGWLTLQSMISMCRADGIDYRIVDNARFRNDPDGVLARLCEAWGVPFDPAMTGWTDLSEALPRVVMSALASGPEYEWYYEGTLGSTGGIIRTDHDLLPIDRFPAELRGSGDEYLSVDEATGLYHRLLADADHLA